MTRPGPREDSRPATRPRYPKGQATRELLLRVAHDHISALTHHDVRIVDITRAAGVAAGTFYTYFESKEDLIREIADAAMSELRRGAYVSEELATTDPARAIERSTRGFFSSCVSNRGTLRSIETLSTSDDGVRESRRRSLTSSARRSQRLIVHLQNTGVTDPTLDAWMTAVSLQAMTVTMGYDHLVRREPPMALDSIVVPVTRIWLKTLDLEG